MHDTPHTRIHPILSCMHAKGRQLDTLNSNNNGTQDAEPEYRRNLIRPRSVNLERGLELFLVYVLIQIMLVFRLEFFQRVYSIITEQGLRLRSVT
jgi:hypothetical protein